MRGTDPPTIRLCASYPMSYTTWNLVGHVQEYRNDCKESSINDGSVVGGETGSLVGRESDSLVGREMDSLVGREIGSLVAFVCSFYRKNMCMWLSMKTTNRCDFLGQENTVATFSRKNKQMRLPKKERTFATFSRKNK